MSCAVVSPGIKRGLLIGGDAGAVGAALPVLVPLRTRGAHLIGIRQQLDRAERQRLGGDDHALAADAGSGAGR